MNDEDKTKEQLTEERVSMRQRIAELEESEAEHRRVELRVALLDDRTLDVIR